MEGKKLQCFSSIGVIFNRVLFSYYRFLADSYCVQHSTDRAATWEASVQVNEDLGAHHQIFPTIDISNGALHVAWYDLRNSAPSRNDLLDVYNACSNTTGVSYPAFSHNVRVSDVSHS